MKTIACEWIERDTKGYICARCNLKTCVPRVKRCRNQTLPIGDGSYFLRSAKQKPPTEPTNCIHFLGPTGEQTEAVKCGGCKTATPMTMVAECELHGLVTFIHRAKDEAFKCCKNCKDFSTA